jgi:Phage protein Gp138 N-terminal domain
MDRDERWESVLSAISAAIETAKGELRVSMPVIVVSYDASTQQVVVKPAVQDRQRQPDGTWKNVSISPLPPIPVKHPSAGGVTITLPIAEGDEGTVQVSDRCIDGWYVNGGVAAQTDYRMHDMSDAFYSPGGRSMPRQLSGVSTTTAQMRTDDGTMVLDFDPANKKITVTTPNPLVLNGDLHVSGKVIAGYGGVDQVALQTHTHGGGPEPDPGSS